MATAMIRTQRRTQDGPKSRTLRLGSPRRRRPRLLIGSLAVLLACSALFASAYERAGRQEAVLAVAQSVAQGATIQASDLVVARMAANGAIAPIPATDLSLVVGRRAAVALVRGGILTASDLSRSAAVPAGEAVVGISAKSSQLPAEGVTPGETVDVVLTGVPGSPALAPGATAGSSGTAASSGAGAQPLQLSGAVLAASALVTSVGAPPTAGNDATDVSLLVPLDVAPVIATASAAGQVALIAVGAAR